MTATQVPARARASDLLLLAVAVGAVSTSAPLIRAAHAPALAIAFWRTTLAVPVMGSVVVARDRGALRRLDRPTRRRTVVSGLLLAGHFATWIPSLSYTSVASSVTLVCAQPVWVALVERRRGTHVPPAVWRGIVLALAGVVVLTGVDLALTPRALFGDALALLGGVLSGLYLIVGSDVRRVTTTAVYTTACYAVAGVALLGVCLTAGSQLGGYPSSTWLALLALTAGPQLLGHTVVNRVVGGVSTTVISVAILFEIVGSTVLAWWFFSETPPWAALPAAVLIGAGVVVVARSTDTV